MLFGRRKKGFVRIESIDEYPSKINEDKMKAQEDKILKDKRQDLLDYLEGLDTEAPDLYDEIEEAKEDKPRFQLLADFIRERSRGAQLTSKASLEQEEENLKKLLDLLKNDETCTDIKSIKGSKDTYFYSAEFMTRNYAMIAVLVEEKDVIKTIAKMVRWNCKVYPCATPLYYFKNSPYFLTDKQIEFALNKMKRMEEYSDICEVVTGNNVRYLYSSKIMSKKYAKALAEDAEYGEYGYR